MTKVQLLRNLTESNYNYKVVSDTKDGGARNLSVIILDAKGGYPIYYLRYRLDIDYLAEVQSLGCTNIRSNDLKAFEFAAI